MRDAVIIYAVRTAVGKGKPDGALSGIHPVDLSAHVLKALAERNSLDPATVDDVIWGCVSQVGEQTGGVGRYAVLAAGWPESVPGTTIDRQCGSSQQAVHQAAAAVASGQAELVVAGGVESMTRVTMGASVGAGTGLPYGSLIRARYAGVEGFEDGAPIPFNQGVGAEMIAARWGFSRTQLDEFALASHAKAAAAQDAGEFDAEIVPVESVKQDEGIRRDSSLAKLAELKTPFKEDGVVTAGSASQISDGAAALAITTSGWAKAHGLTPLARIHTAVVAGDDPVVMLTAPIPATAKALRRARLTLADIGVYEVNEAFAPVPLAWLVETRGDPAPPNPRGGPTAPRPPPRRAPGRLRT